MATLSERVLTYVRDHPGATDRQIADALLGMAAQQAPVNTATRLLGERGHIMRRGRPDGILGNYLSMAATWEGTTVPNRSQVALPNDATAPEDHLKAAIKTWLEGTGWMVSTAAWTHTRGADIEAVRSGGRWLIQVARAVVNDSTRVASFDELLGGMLRRMGDTGASYSIALLDREDCRALWAQVPEVARARTRISALFVDGSGRVRHDL